MEIYVYDTYAKKKNGSIMHFDVFTSERNDNKAYSFAKEWLKEIGENAEAALNQRNCRYCHVERNLPKEIENEIKTKGYYIYKMEGCPE